MVEKAVKYRIKDIFRDTPLIENGVRLLHVLY